MARHKKLFGWHVAILPALIVGVVYWAGSTGCTPVPEVDGSANDNAADVESNGNQSEDNETTSNENENQNSDANNGDASGFVLSKSSCEPLDSETGGFAVSVEGLTREGVMLTYYREVMTDPAADENLKIITEMTADGEMLMSIVATTVLERVEVEVEYGSMFSGVRRSTSIVEDGMVSGTVDDRAIIPVPIDDVDPALTKFADGSAAPETGLDPDIQEGIEALFQAASAAAENCQSDAAGSSTVRALIPTQDHGHDSDPETSGGCIACWAGCSSAAAGCIVGVSVGCAGALIFYAVCEVVAVAGCAIAYGVCVLGCNATGAPCCPVSCGEVACCATEEICLNSSIGLCCSPGKTPCVGESCCSSTEACIDTGPNAGTCCQPEDVCGNTCCEATDSCIEAANLCCPTGEAPCDDKCCASSETCLGEGLCCDPDNACGTACCGELDSCIESLNLCCGFAQPACNTQCCQTGESCLGGTTCCAINLVCGTFCCSEGTSCDANTLTCNPCPNPTDTPCTVGGCCPAGMNCTDFEGICCPQGETYCFNACRPLSQCIN